jgi:glycosyltransferase involved in cell wall biosynthesis
VDLGRFARGDRAGFRQRHRIPPEAFVVGHVGRLAQEKNLGFLAEALARYLASDPRAHCLIVGSGPCQEEMQAALAEFARQERLHMVGVLEGQELIDAYHAMDLFAFASQSETQGMVVTEAMAAGLPVVALDGPGVRDVVRDRANGRLVSVNHRQLFANALLWVASRAPEHQATLRKAALATAEQFSMPRMAQRALRLYEALCAQNGQTDLEQASTLARARRRLSAEWDLLSNVAHAATCALEENAPLVPQ